MSRQDFEAALEAILFVTGEPVSRDRLLAVFDEGEREEAAAALERLRERYRPDETRGVFLEEVAGGLRIVTAPECHPFLRKFFDAAGANRLSMAALETLAIVAYRQPVTGPEIQELRGKNPSAALRTLLERRMIRISGRKEVVGRPFLYDTTREFLMHFGLRTLGELPPLEEFEEAFGGEGGDEASPIAREHQAIGLVSATEAEKALGVDDGFDVHGPSAPEPAGEPASESEATADEPFAAAIEAPGAADGSER
jgi:segregation and condensation protein B